jgi:Glyoxalase-like domain
MTAKFQLMIDCAHPEPLARFWGAALGYEFEPPPDGYGNWDNYWRAVGMSDAELAIDLASFGPADPAYLNGIVAHPGGNLHDRTWASRGVGQRLGVRGDNRQW